MNVSKILYANLLFLLVIVSPFIALAQAEGIRFEHAISWPVIVAKAKAENKYIFLDCYATWCGPCKYMSQKIFVQKSVADFFNDHFINVAVQMDETAHDSEAVRQWYGVAKEIEKKYSIDAYPTFLFFSPDGEAVHRLVGSFEAEKFVAKAKEALITEKQYYVLLNTYKEHLDDSLFLSNALRSSLQSYDQLSAARIAKHYIACLKNPFAKDNIDLIIRVNPSNSEEIFRFFLDNASKIDEAVDRQPNRKSIENILSRIITDMEINIEFK